MTKKEKEFLDSIKRKIKIYEIPTTVKKVFQFASKEYEYTTYNDGSTELVNIGIEQYLCYLSPYYFINKYAFISFPKVGVIPYQLYYFQENTLKEILTYDKFVFDKTRQCLTEENFVMTNRGYISIKDVKTGDKIETIIDGENKFVKVIDAFYSGKKEICHILTNSGLTIDCTLDHKIFTKRGWIEAGKLSLEDEILSYNQSFEKIRKIVHKNETYDVYDITTESSDFLTNGLLVHNCGLSTLTSLYCLWRCNFHEAEFIDVVSIKQDKAQKFVAKMRPTMDKMPYFLRTPLAKDNQQELEWENGSIVLSESQSENAGRSDSLSLLVLDEAAHYRSERMVRGIVSAAQPTLSRTGGQFIIISTPNKTSGPGAYYYEQVTNARLNMESGTRFISIDWWEVPDMYGVAGPKKGYNDKLQEFIQKDYWNNEEVKEEARNFFDPIAEKHWKDNPWLKKQYQDLGEVLYKQEILHNFVVSGNSVFSDDILSEFEENIVEPIQKDSIGKVSIRNLWIWKRPIPKHRYIIGVDVSTGTGNDSASIQVIDIDEYEQAAEYKGMASTKAIARFVKIIANYYNEAFVAIECNSIGEAVFNDVYYHDTDPYLNVYKRKKTKNGVTRMTGWITDTKTRKLITNDFIDWITVEDLWNQIKLYSKRLYIELTTWIWDGNKPIHESSAQDDAIMAISIALYLRNEATKAGESYLITESGDLVETDSKDNYEEIDEKIEKEDFGILQTGQEDEDVFKKQFGVEEKDFHWLIGKT